MSNEISKVLDMDFFTDGNAVACLNEGGVLRLFNVEMSEI